MASLTDSEIAQIAKEQREPGVQRLSSHFSWLEFLDERRRFHQEFVYDVAMFAAARGFPWPEVIRAAVIAKGIFPQLHGLDEHQLLSLLGDALCDCLPNLTTVHQHELTQFLTDTCVTRRRLLHAVVGGAANMSITRLHIELQLPPTPCSLAQGTDLDEWERRVRQLELTAMLQQKEEQLEVLRDRSRFTVGDVTVSEEEQLDEEVVLSSIRAALRVTENQMLESLTKEASLLADIMQLKQQLSQLATGRLQNPATSHPERPVMQRRSQQKL